MESLPPAAVFGAFATVAAAVIATAATLYSTRTSKELALAKLQMEQQAAKEAAHLARDQADLERDKFSGASFKDIVVHLTAEVDKKQATIDRQQARIDALEERIRQKEEQEMERRARCLRSGEPCREGSLPLTLPGVIRPKKQAQAQATEEGDDPEGG
jgi:flagellar motility protein MotE (MotC chaperone)